MHGGRCHNLVNRFTCSCPDGYNGARCQYDINECDSNPCMHGGRCHNLVNRFTCSCPDGYNGAQCEYNINECDSNPCMHGGTCHNLVNRFICSCPDEYYGIRCEYEKCTESHGVQELNFTKLTENITFSSFDHLPGIYGQSCDGERLTVNFPETELTWSREIHTITMTANDNRGHSTSCVLSVKMKDMIPPSFLDCPSVDIVQDGCNGGSLVTWSPIHVEDNSGNVTVSSSNSNGEFMKFGSHLISYNAADEFGNTNQCNFTVNVKKLRNSVCDIPPQVFHGVISCHDGHTLSCGIDRCEPGYLQTNTTNHVCSNGIWKPQFSAEFASSSCIKPEPIHLERNYTFRFTCPNLKFSPTALRDCIKQSDLCPTGDILLCDKPFQRIEGKYLASKDLQIWTTLEGILPYDGNRSGLINRMDRHGNSIAAYFKNGNFKQTCHQLRCQFEHIKPDSLREVCGNGTVEFIIHGKRMCHKFLI
ncbi:sushi, nidogen and EGF-like domain-containing protein 1 isoform X2 [Ostrea edulis]|uniref:sushi, nidogen and EGF-like domain-containing protein 1 isoform X2 n=1 Tax=Ostrea edulis TaxID=37623 RepID=UPI0024AF9599|nr:sushi, nidogen and EGF-like domain-containing protein 1 isoform X2 [Ostrea edulis]